MRVLHLTFENFQDVPGLLARGHSFFGDQGVLATLVPSHLGFPNGICLKYPLLDAGPFSALSRIVGRHNVTVMDSDLRLRIKGEKPLERVFFKGRDIIWLNKLNRAWRRYDLSSFDVYHFDGDVPFIYGDRILKRLGDKRIVTHFFGSELRKWGMNPYLRERAHLRFTSELDHTRIDPSLIFVPIPYEVGNVKPRPIENKILRVGHSPTRRTAKGTADIIRAVERLKGHLDFEFLLIEGVPHWKCMELKATCDIGVDQIGNYAGTGYGRSGLEFLALGVPTITEIPEVYEPLLPGHPFVKADKGGFEDVLHRLLTDRKLRALKRKQGLHWVRDFPNPRRIMARIYEEYHGMGWIH
jgi:glycosyltransferase involved in cell wall biosynthesis